MDKLLEKIERLKKERDAVILAHYYVDDLVQEIADYIGDSYYLSEIATKITNKTIVFCGVTFMGESAKILNPEKTVLLPDIYADCPMAHMVNIEKIEELREKYDDLAVVCYINSTAEIKTYADVCVTSSNAMKIVKSLPNKHIYFIPDENLGSYIAAKVPEKEFILNDGFCCVHKDIKKEDLIKLKQLKPNAKVLTHPECTKDIIELSDFIGSTSEIINYATKSKDKDFIICTEMGVLYELKKKNKDKNFYFVGNYQICENMKKINLKKVADCLENMSPSIEMSESLRIKANEPLVKMLKLAK